MIGFGKKGKFENLEIKTVEDVQKYLQLFDDKLIEQNNLAEQKIERFENVIDSFENRFNERIDKLDTFMNKIELVIESSSKTENVELQLSEIVTNIKSFSKIEGNIKGLFTDEIKPIQEYAINQQEKLNRHETGYDKKILGRFYKDIYKILDFIKKEQQKDNNEALEEVEEDLLILLENSNVYKLDISKGNQYDNEKLDAYVEVEYVDTENKEDDNKIIKIKKDGYILKNSSYEIPQRNAKIVVSKFKNMEKS